MRWQKTCPDKTGKFVNELDFPWRKKLKQVTTYGAPSMIGEKTDLLGRIRRKVNKQNFEFCMNFTYSSLNSHLVETQWNLKMLWRLRHYFYQKCTLNMGMPYQTEVWWLSRETQFSRTPEIEMFTNETRKAVAELADRKWLWNLALLCDIGYHLKD